MTKNELAAKTAEELGIGTYDPAYTYRICTEDTMDVRMTHFMGQHSVSHLHLNGLSDTPQEMDEALRDELDWTDRVAGASVLVCIVKDNGDVKRLAFEHGMVADLDALVAEHKHLLNPDGTGWTEFEAAVNEHGEGIGRLAVRVAETAHVRFIPKAGR